MMTRVIAVLSVLVLVGCGADGEPIRPQLQNTIGIGIGDDGLTLRRSTTVGVSQGRVSAGISF